MLFFSYTERKKGKVLLHQPSRLGCFFARKFVLVQLQIQLIKTYIAQFSMEHYQMRFKIKIYKRVRDF